MTASSGICDFLYFLNSFIPYFFVSSLIAWHFFHFLSTYFLCFSFQIFFFRFSYLVFDAVYYLPFASLLGLRGDWEQPLNWHLQCCFFASRYTSAERVFWMGRKSNSECTYILSYLIIYELKTLTSVISEHRSLVCTDLSNFGLLLKISIASLNILTLSPLTL